MPRFDSCNANDIDENWKIFRIQNAICFLWQKTQGWIFDEGFQYPTSPTHALKAKESDAGTWIIITRVTNDHSVASDTQETNDHTITWIIIV